MLAGVCFREAAYVLLQDGGFGPGTATELAVGMACLAAAFGLLVIAERAARIARLAWAG